MFHVEESAIHEMTQWSPDVIIFLQGANDASRDKLSMFEMRLRRWLTHLTARESATVLAPRGGRAARRLTRRRVPGNIRRGTSRRGASRSQRSSFT